MSEKKINLLIPGMATPEGAARLQREMEKRNDIDFRAFQMLRRLVDEDVATYQSMFRALKALDFDHDEAKEMAEELDEEIREILRDRVQADHDVLQAAAGRPAR